MKLTAYSEESWVETIWDILQEARETLLPEGDPESDRRWDDICTAMAWISETLGVEVEMDNEPEEDSEND